MYKINYFDYAATTPVDDDVLAAMMPYFSGNFGNPSSIHTIGQSAEAALEKAREDCGSCLGIAPRDVIFTSGGTESDNLALRGCAFSQRKSNAADEIIISPVEHHAVSKTAWQLSEEFGFKVISLPVDQFGMVDPDDVRKRISSKTALVTVIYGNNEIGTINPVPEIGAVCQEMGVPFHSDAVQAGAHLKMDMQRDQLNMISIGAHKMYGPKGIGLLGIKNLKNILPVQTGGGHEFNMRAGTQNVPLIVGMAKAFSASQDEIIARNNHLTDLRDYLVSSVLNSVSGAQLTGHPESRLPNHASFVFEGIDGNRLVMYLDAKGFACSSGSACKVGSPQPSELLLAMGFSEEMALGSLRITLGKDTTREKIDSLVVAIHESIEKLRK